MSKKICPNCGDIKDFMHYPTCLKNQTRQCIEEILSALCVEQQIGQYSQLLQFGMDDVTVYWCKQALTMSNNVTDRDIKRFLYESILQVINMSEEMMKYPPMTNRDNICHVCSKDLADCKQERDVLTAKVKASIDKRIDYETEIELKHLTHFSLDVLGYFIKTIDEQNALGENFPPSSSSTGLDRIDLLAELLWYFIEEMTTKQEPFSTMAMADKEIGW